MSDYTAVDYVLDGLNVQEFTDLFGVTKKRVEEAVSDLAALGKRDGRQIYPFREVAKRLLAHEIDSEELARAIAQMQPKDLPISLQKDFWAGQIARQKFEEAEGDLWRTEAVMDHFAAAFKALRQEILLFGDTIEAQTGLTEDQRVVLYDLSDALLSNLHDALVKRFGGDALSES